MKTFFKFFRCLFGCSRVPVLNISAIRYLFIEQELIEKGKL